MIIRFLAWALCVSVASLAPGQIPGKYADHLSDVTRMINSDLKPAINLAQTALSGMDGITTKLAADRVLLAAAEKEHSALNQVREQAWARVVKAIQDGIGTEPGTIDYAEHMMRVQSLIQEANEANNAAEVARKVLVSIRASVADGEASLAVASAEHDTRNRKRVSV